MHNAYVGDAMSIATNAEVSTTAGPSLRGQVAFVADGSGPIGAEIARKLALNGATVALWGDDRQKLNLVATEIAASGGKASIVLREVSEKTGILDIQKAVIGNIKNIDIFINNVPEIAGHTLEDLNMADFANNIGMVLKDSLGLLQAIISIMRRQKYGRVVNIFNLAYLGLPRQVDVAAAYAGIFGLSRSVALEAARDGITVNSIVKGDVIEPKQNADDIATTIAAIPVRRIGSVEDVVHALKYLISPATGYVTGQTLFVCGGRSIYFSLSV